MPAENRVPVTGIQEQPTDWSSRHLADNELLWFGFNPWGLAEFVRRYGTAVDLADRIMECRRAAWACGSYVQFTETRGRRGNVVGRPGAVLARRLHSA